MSIEWGTNVVGGVKPGFEGEHLGLPVLPSVRVVGSMIFPVVGSTHDSNISTGQRETKT
jgi:succinyl-CoA synthetase alpha subunit